jgi:hypothetical protein
MSTTTTSKSISTIEPMAILPGKSSPGNFVASFIGLLYLLAVCVWAGPGANGFMARWIGGSVALVGCYFRLAVHLFIALHWVMKSKGVGVGPFRLGNHSLHHSSNLTHPSYHLYLKYHYHHPGHWSFSVAAAGMDGWILNEWMAICVKACL